MTAKKTQPMNRAASCDTRRLAFFGFCWASSPMNALRIRARGGPTLMNVSKSSRVAAADMQGDWS
jgi:hypothetical protein